MPLFTLFTEEVQQVDAPFLLFRRGIVLQHLADGDVQVIGTTSQGCQVTPSQIRRHRVVGSGEQSDNSATQWFQQVEREAGVIGQLRKRVRHVGHKINDY